jgi:hypothetical protein
VAVLRWKDPDPSADLSKAWNPRLLPVGVRRPVEPSWQNLRREPDGHLTRVLRYTGSFSVQMQLREFPRDRHVLRVRFAVPQTSPEALRFVPGGMSNPEAGASIPDWNVDPASIRADPVLLPEFGIRLAAFSLEVPVRRRLSFAIWGVLLPLLCILLMAWSVFWFPQAHFGTKISISTTAVLTLIAYRFVFATMVPKLPYLTRMDEFMVGATLLVFGAFVKMVAESILIGRKQEDAAGRLDRRLRWVFPVLLAGLVAWTILL